MLVAMVEAEESEHPGLLKTRNLLILRSANNAQYDKIAANWKVSGTRGFRELQPVSGDFSEVSPGTACREGAASRALPMLLLRSSLFSSQL